MTSHSDRLAGIEVWLAGLAAPGTGTVLIMDRTASARSLHRSLATATGPALVLGPTGRPYRPPTGWDLVARYGVFGPVSEPQWLVRLDLPGARAWFADSVRPAWGLPGRVARRLGRWPAAARWAFHGTAALLVPEDGPRDRWAGPAGLTGPAGPPIALATGTGATSGRLVISYGDPTGRPARHVKLGPVGQARPLRSEREVLVRLAGTPGVPAAAGTASNEVWYASGQDHLPGVSLQRHWSGGVDRIPGIAAVLDWLATTTAPRGLVHGDLWPANVLLGPAGIGVVDWEAAGPGDPLLDAVFFLVTADPAADADPVAATVRALTAPAAGAGLGRLLAATGRPGLAGAELRTELLAALTTIAARSGPGGRPDPDRRSRWLAGRDALAAAGQRP
ncbi:phosphotransferase [Microlunatus sp. GCM10028923]|uniref:phosphotransferase n=1 Tax=Microlunatus sp. GCM10028923 TaxID=3273400 RepID=UPI00360845C1